MKPRTLDTDLFNEVLQLIERETANERLIDKLAKTGSIERIGGSIKVTFSPTLHCTILFNDENYFLVISDSKWYYNEDNETTKMSGDRIFYYLEKLVETALYGR